jgi:hypothetical protein
LRHLVAHQANTCAPSSNRCCTSHPPRSRSRR